MTKSLDMQDVLAVVSNPDLVQRLVALLDRISLDAATGDLTIANGPARVTLALDGTVRIHGRRIVQDAEREIALSAAWIDLN